MITRRKWISGIATTMAATAVAAAETSSKRDDSVSRRHQSDTLTLHIEQPAHGAETGVLLLPRIYGLEQAMVENAKQIAVQGMTAVVWDPYQGKAAQPMNGSTALNLSRTLVDESALSHISNAIDYMEHTLGVKRVAILGWCLGGRFALLAAANDSRIQSVVVYHPTIYPTKPTTIDTRKVMPSTSPRGPSELIIHRGELMGQTIEEFSAVANIQCPVRLIQPGYDLMQPADYARIIDILNGRSAVTCTEYYPLASHGFSSRQEFEANAQAHNVSWPMTMAFLKHAAGPV